MAETTGYPDNLVDLLYQDGISRLHRLSEAIVSNQPIMPSCGKEWPRSHGPSLLTQSVVRVCREEPPARVDRRPDIGAGCAVSLSYNSLGLIDTNITEGRDHDEPEESRS